MHADSVSRPPYGQVEENEHRFILAGVKKQLVGSQEARTTAVAPHFWGLDLLLYPMRAVTGKLSQELWETLLWLHTQMGL